MDHGLTGASGRDVTRSAAAGRPGIAHAFGGALALAYYAEPRATDDIDVNAFVEPAAGASVLEAVAPLDVESDLDEPAVDRDGQCRLWWGRTPLDLLFAYDEIHEAMRRDARLVPFGEDRLPILSPVERDLAYEQVEDLDIAEIRAWLGRIVGVQDPRMRRFDEVLAALGGA